MNPTMTRTAVDPVPVAAKRVAWAIIAGLVGPILDTTIVTIAIARLGSDLHASVATVQWVSTAYLLALAVTVPLAGWSARRFGSRAAWTVGLLLFLGGSIACATAWNAASLIAFRVAQGIGAGLLLPLMTSILVAASGGAALGRLVSMVSLPTALGPILGPVAGGLILNWLDWRWLFLVNVPLSAVALLMVRRIPADRGEAGRFDTVGLALLAPGLAALLLGLSEARTGFVHIDVLAPLAAGAVLLIAFAGRGLRGGGSSLLDVRTLRRPVVAASSAALFFFGLASYGVMLLLPLYLQREHHESVLHAALILIPQGVGALATRSLAGRLTDALGARVVAVAGFALITVTTLPFALAGPATGLGWLSVALLARGFGLGTLLSPVMAAAFVGLPDTLRHDASMLTRTFLQVGGSFGTAVLAAVLTAGGGGGFRDAFRVATGLAAVGVVAALRLPSRAAR